MPRNLSGLRLEDFMHPDDMAAIKALRSAKGIEQFVSVIEDKSNQIIIRMNTLGSCVRINERNSPKIFRSVRDVCEILDYDRVPEIYSIREYKFDIVPSGVEAPVLVIPDAVLRELDGARLFFTIGRAITRLKSDYLKFYIAATIMASAAGIFPLVSDAVTIPLANWMRKSELTADRGGLLACQDFNTSMRCLMYNAGMPFEETKSIDIPAYIESTRETSRLVIFGRGVKTLNNTRGWVNDRIIELFNWYGEGHYDNLLDKCEKNF